MSNYFCHYIQAILTSDHLIPTDILAQSCRITRMSFFMRHDELDFTELESFSCCCGYFISYYLFVYLGYAYLVYQHLFHFQRNDSFLF